MPTMWREMGAEVQFRTTRLGGRERQVWAYNKCSEHPVQSPTILQVIEAYT